ncbi:MAG: GPW/gp25 family protein [Lachnospiraceae bacterium]|nr:GPW/gp25 family protein [Lachnospiraceae bacterium]
MGNEFLGTGMKFPPSVNPTTGRFELSSGTAGVKESIYIVLMTQKSERWLRPGFGSQIQRFAFADPNPTILNLMKLDIVNDIKTSEPRVTDVTVRFDAISKPGYLLVDIEYTIAESNTRDNLVFPFYLNGASEEKNEEQQG